MAEEEKESKVEEFMEIGGSPVPGITLRHVLRGHTDAINRFAWSPDGHYIASPSDDRTVRIWDVERGECVKVLTAKVPVFSVAWSPNGRQLAFDPDENIIILDIASWVSVVTCDEEVSSFLKKVDWSPDGQNLVSGSHDTTPRIWDTRTGMRRALLDQGNNVNDVAWSPSGQKIAVASDNMIIKVWNPATSKLEMSLEGHSQLCLCVAWSPNQPTLASAGYDNSICLWDTQSGQRMIVLEGHTQSIQSLSFSSDGILLASKSKDDSVRLWRTDTWESLVILEEEGNGGDYVNLSFHPRLPYLATLGERDSIIRIWDIDHDVLLANSSALESIRYTTAKLVLVGDSGVGKTGLGWRLAHDEFKEHSSTHGQQFWVVPELKKTRDDGTECEAVLWDLAGQHIYRSIHSIFLDDVDASLVLFDPTNRQEPLKGAQFWLEQLKGKKLLPPSVLVGARLDRGAPVLSQQELDQFCQKYGVSGGYIGTSAKSGEGLGKLIETLKDQIPWDQMTTTVTTVTFKRIKEFVLSLKEKPDRKGVLVRPDDLRKQLQATDKDWQFTDAEMMTAVGHLANHGYVTILKSSSGDEYILLVPELLASVASSIFLHADKHPRELGAINETDLLQGKYPIEEFKGLEKEEQHVLLDATVVRFLEHSVCFRETLGNDNLLEVISKTVT